MRLTPFISTTLLVLISAPLFAQDVEFASRQDRFTCVFPTQPKVTETMYQSQHEAYLPARVYSASQGQSRYSVTVVDYNQAQRILTEKAKSCPVGAEPCLGGPGDEGHWKSDIRGAIDWATWQIMKRDTKVTLFVWAAMDGVEGRQMQLTNPDKSRTLSAFSCIKTNFTSAKEPFRPATLNRHCSSNRWGGSTKMGSGCAIRAPTTIAIRRQLA